MPSSPRITPMPGGKCWWNSCTSLLASPGLAWAGFSARTQAEINHHNSFRRSLPLWQATSLAAAFLDDSNPRNPCLRQRSYGNRRCPHARRGRSRARLGKTRSGSLSGVRRGAGLDGVGDLWGKTLRRTCPGIALRPPPGSGHTDSDLLSTRVQRRSSGDPARRRPAAVEGIDRRIRRSAPRLSTVPNAGLDKTASIH